MPLMNGFGLVRIMARLVGAPNVRDSAELLRSSRNLRLVKAFLPKKRLDPRDVAFDVQNLWSEIDIVFAWNGRGRNQPGPGIE